MTLEILLAALWLGMFAAGATCLIRALPFVIPLLEAGKKPWICDKCMSFWLILLGVSAVPEISKLLKYPLKQSVFFLAGPAAYAVALWMLRVLTEPLGPPPSFNTPDLIDLEIPETESKTYMPPFSDPPPAH